MEMAEKIQMRLDQIAAADLIDMGVVMIPHIKLRIAEKNATREFPSVYFVPKSRSPASPSPGTI